MATLFQKHVAKWRDCQRCPLCKTRQRVVIARGKIPCDLLFVGEAPGESEDTVGIPFAPGAPAGGLLERIIARSIPSKYRLAFCNLVGCIPRNSEDSGKASEPLPEEIAACSPKIREFIGIAKPRLIICVGALARDYLDPRTHRNVWRPDAKRRMFVDDPISPLASIPRIDITHPGAIVRQKLAVQSFAVQRTVVQLQNALEEYHL